MPGRAYWDVNAWRLGYGSDTEGPDQVHVTEGMETTKARALQNLALRIPQFQTEAVYGKTGMGRDTWDKLTDNQKSAVSRIYGGPSNQAQIGCLPGGFHVQRRD